MSDHPGTTPRPVDAISLPAEDARGLTVEEHRVLSMGRVRLHDYHNVAAGFGMAVLDLTRAGLMRAAWQDDFDLLRGPDRWMTYTVTRAGRDVFVSYGRPYVPITPAPALDTGPSAIPRDEHD